MSIRTECRCRNRAAIEQGLLEANIAQGFTGWREGHSHLWSADEEGSMSVMLDKTGEFLYAMKRLYAADVKITIFVQRSRPSCGDSYTHRLGTGAGRLRKKRACAACSFNHQQCLTVSNIRQSFCRWTSGGMQSLAWSNRTPDFSPRVSIPLDVVIEESDMTN